MKVLMIIKGAGYFSIDGSNKKSISEIDVKNINKIILKLLENEEVEYDEISDQNKINNPAEAIIYEKISIKLGELKDKKSSILKEIEDEFKAAHKKYVEAE